MKLLNLSQKRKETMEKPTFIKKNLLIDNDTGYIIDPHLEPKFLFSLNQENVINKSEKIYNKKIKMYFDVDNCLMGNCKKNILNIKI